MWKTFWAWLWTWKGLLPAGLALAATAYYGPRKMLETWDWYWDRFRDNEVYFVITRRKFLAMPRAVMGGVRMEQIEIPFQTNELADFLRRSEKSIARSLERLTKRGKIERYKDGWRCREQ